MAPPLAYAERLRIVQLWNEGHSQVQIRDLTGHSRPTIALWIRRALQTGSVTPNKRVSYVRVTTTEQDEGIRKLHSQYPFLPLKKIAAKFNVSEKTVWRRLYTDKKVKSNEDETLDALQCVETQMEGQSPPPEYNLELNMCRICLQSFSKLISIESYGLRTAYEQLTGVSVEHDDGLPRELCVECATLLDKYHKFRDKSIKGDQLLRQLYDKDDVTDKLPLGNIDQAINNLASKLDYSPGVTCVEIEPATQDQDKEFNVPETQVFSHNDIKEEIIDTDLNLDMTMEQIQENWLAMLTDNVTEDVTSEMVTSIHDDNGIIKDDLSIEEVIEKQDKLNAEKIKLERLNEHFIVKELNVVEQKRWHRKRKTSADYLCSEFKCDKCYDVFRSKRSLKRHNVVHNADRGAVLCVICKARYSQPIDLKTHIEENHMYIYHCKTCNFDYYKRKLALKHMKKHL